MIARNRQTGDRRPDVIRARRQALAALRRVRAERKRRAEGWGRWALTDRSPRTFRDESGT